MKRILTYMLILPLVFVTGCSEEEENPAGSSESYTVEDLAGTWDTISQSSEISARQSKTVNVPHEPLEQLPLLLHPLGNPLFPLLQLIQPITINQKLLCYWFFPF